VLFGTQAFHVARPKTPKSTRIPGIIAQNHWLSSGLPANPLYRHSGCSCLRQPQRAMATARIEAVSLFEQGQGVDSNACAK
jgi:hypothetical protein